MNIESPDRYLVNIYLVQFNDDGQWEQLDQLLQGQPNRGEAAVSIPLLVEELEGRQQLVQDIVSVAVQVRVGGYLDETGSQSLIQQLENRAVQWTSSLYYSLSDTFRQKCQDWCDTQPDNIGEDIVSELTPCPPLVQQARLPNSGLVEDQGISRLLSNTFFHRGTEICFRSRQARFVHSCRLTYSSNDSN